VDKSLLPTISQSTPVLNVVLDWENPSRDTDYFALKSRPCLNRRYVQGHLWVDSFVFVAAHPLKTFALFAANGVLLMGVVAIYLTCRWFVPSNTGFLILLMIIAQQLLMIARAGLRVALVASEIDLYRRLRPAVPVLATVDAAIPQTVPHDTPVEPAGSAADVPSDGEWLPD
jgi:hypothetical protein